MAMTSDYTFTVDSITLPATNTYTWNDNWWWNNNFSYTYTTCIYMYQIFCPKPRCKGVFWGQLNTVGVCPKCSSTIKITDAPEPDYEVQVNK